LATLCLRSTKASMSICIPIHCIISIITIYCHHYHHHDHYYYYYYYLLLLLSFLLLLFTYQYREKGVELTGAIEHQLHQHHAMWRRDQGHPQPSQGFPKLAAAPSGHPHHMQATGRGPLMLENAPQGVTCLQYQRVTGFCTLHCLMMPRHTTYSLT